MPVNTTRDLGRLLVSVCRLHHTRADQSVDRLGLYRGQARLLKLLAAQDGMTHTEIAERLEISPAAVTKVIKRMEQEDYIRRQADPADERLSRVFLQARGQAVTAAIEAAFDRLDGAMLAGLSEAEMEQLQVLLARMQANLQEFQP